ncbi:hypothetical protein E6H31_04705 [Candidatus Bathyarchaeota archaeon]|nr:MAG: hypothetical protein E6H31_04705 [Candidatus Bathyarchaeota archaeon]
MAICKLLYDYLGFPFEEKSDWTLSDYVNDATAKIRTTGDHKAASNAFKKAAEDYRLGAKKVPGLAALLGELSAYMEAWSLVEEARLRHSEEQYSLAAEDYAQAANLFQRTGAWAHLSRIYGGSSLLEKGEALSREEREEDALKMFTSAAGAFREAQTSLKTKRDQLSQVQETKELDNWFDASRSLEKYCHGRVDLEEAKVLDKKGAEEESGARYRSASIDFRELMSEAQTEQIRVELEALTLFCEARSKMKEAETRASPELYAEAADLFTRAEKVAQARTFRHVALASSSICWALESGTSFRRTRNTQLYSEIKKHLETATDYYEGARWQNAADWTRATGKLFDALVYLTDAAVEREPKKKTELYHLAEKHLQLAARLYGQASFPVKRDEALRLLERARQEKELLLTPIEALSGNPALTRVPGTPESLTKSQPSGLEGFEEANVVGNLGVVGKDFNVGSDLTIELEVANVGRTAARLIKLENIVVEGMQLDKHRIAGQVNDDFIDMKGKRLEYLGAHEVKIPMKATRAGVFQLQPKILFVDEKGNYRSNGFGPLFVTVRELGISGWLKGPK